MFKAFIYTKSSLARKASQDALRDFQNQCNLPTGRSVLTQEYNDSGYK